MTTTTLARITPTPRPRPAYLEPVELAEYGVRMTRIGGDTGAPISPVVGGTWHNNARHRYSRIPFWSPDGSLAFIEQKGASSRSRPSKIIVDGETFAPLVANKYAGCRTGSHDARRGCEPRPLFRALDPATGEGSTPPLLPHWRAA